MNTAENTAENLDFTTPVEGRRARLAQALNDGGIPVPLQSVSLQSVSVPSVAVPCVPVPCVSAPSPWRRQPVHVARPRRAVIGVDIDGVLCDLHKELFERMSQIGLIKGDREAMDCWAFESCYNVTYNQVMAVASSVIHQQKFNLPHVPGALRAMRELNGLGADVWLITSRPHDTYHVTAEWLKYHSIDYDVLIFETNKAHFAQHVDLMIEDNPTTAESFANQGTDCILLDWPYNRCYQPTSGKPACFVHRACGWQTMLAIADKVIREKIC